MRYHRARLLPSPTLIKPDGRLQSQHSSPSAQRRRLRKSCYRAYAPYFLEDVGVGSSSSWRLRAVLIVL